MNFPRALTGWLGLGTWLYSWSLFVEVRNEFSVTGGSSPAWILVLLGFTTTALIAATGSALMKFWFWPAIAIVAGLAFAGGLIGTQFSIMRAASESVTLGDAFNATLRTRSSIGVVFVTAAPTLLVLAGLAGWFGSRRSRRRLDA